MTKQNLKAAIARRYRASIADKVIQKFPDLSTPQDFDQYCDIIEKMLNQENDRLWRIAFNVYDYNSNKIIDDLDTYVTL